MINLILKLYQKYISPLSHTLGHQLFGQSYACRFTPSCSQYAKEAFQKHSFFRALFLSIVRFLRCQPLSSGGYDPVPDKI